MRIHPALLVLAVVAAGCIEVESWAPTQTQPGAAEPSMADLAARAMRGRPAHPAANARFSEDLFLPHSVLMPPAERQIAAPPRAHVRPDLGS